ncbi:hypothetical protein [Bradymonas sediminis]|uniref:Uncharacterized protein n=1 Tax=Bradymonas sediminis TaxID=1548548 RepID=A0A2Z4FI86_9DELT|nr:hypothetical protein [Bradymonas sediminis]AWV88727.1 hypothetical protein DN745_05000 [Bradymonas sediminis]TDP63580.1 hypothetical protein DFR33_11037 [Bradymonas sediminis]
MRFELQHPDAPHLRAEYGCDEGAGFFFAIYARQEIYRGYDISREDSRALERVLNALVAHGFVTRTSVEEAEYWLQYYWVDEIENPAARRSARIIVNLMRALKS